MFALKDVTELPVHRGLVCGLRLAKSRRCAAVARWTPAAAGVRGRIAHYDSLRAAAARRLLACTLAAAREEGRHLRFLPSCESPHFPSGRAARVKTEFRLAVATRLPAEHGGEWVPPPEWVKRLPVGGAQCACVLAVQSRRAGSRRWTGSSRRCDTGRAKREKKAGAMRQPFRLFLCAIPYTCRSSAIPGSYPARSVRRSRAAGLRPGGPWRRCPTRSPDGWCGSRRSARAV